MKKSLSLILSLTIISAVCAGVLAYVNGLTKDAIAQMMITKTTDAAKAVMPSGVTQVEQTEKYFIGKNAAGEILGYAVRGSDSGGYGGDVVLMVGFQADKKTLVCYKTLSAAETPGLGMKLNTPEFANQFAGKDGTALKVKKDGGTIDAITAATITSRAVCRAIANAAECLK